MHQFWDSLWTPCGSEGPLPDVRLPQNNRGSGAVCGLKAVKMHAGRVNGHQMIPYIFANDKDVKGFVHAVNKRWKGDKLSNVPLPTFVMLLDRFLFNTTQDDISRAWCICAGLARYCVDTMEVHYLSEAAELHQELPANALENYTRKGDQRTQQDPRTQAVTCSIVNRGWGLGIINQWMLQSFSDSALQRGSLHAGVGAPHGRLDGNAELAVLATESLVLGFGDAYFAAGLSHLRVYVPSVR